MTSHTTPHRIAGQGSCRPPAGMTREQAEHAAAKADRERKEQPR